MTMTGGELAVEVVGCSKEVWTRLLTVRLITECINLEGDGD